MHTLTWMHPDGRAGALDERKRVLHVAGGLPGDVVDLEVLRESPRSVDAVAVLRTPSPERRAPPCPWDSGCGGCDLAAWEPAARLVGLARMVQHTLHLPAPPEVVPSPRQVGHRARIKLAIHLGQVGYRGARSHDLVAPGHCGAARPEVQDAHAALAAWLSSNPDLPCTDVEIRSDGTRAVFALHGGRLSTAQRESLGALGDVAHDGRSLHGDPTLRLTVAGLALRASPDAFYQVNLEANERLVAYVVDKVRDARAERVLDLYAGIGNLSLPLATLGAPVLAVDVAGSAIHDLKTAAAAYPHLQVRALAMDAARFDPSREAFDVAVLDPPRAGAGPVLGRVLRNRPRRVVLLSCDLQAAQRDLKAARDAGYELREVRCFDLFPDTRHVETVSVLDRR